MRADANGTLNLDGLLPLMQGAPVGLLAAAAAGATGFQHAAAALAAGAAAVAVRLVIDRRERRTEAASPLLGRIEAPIPPSAVTRSKPDLPTLVAAIDRILDVPDIDAAFRARVKAAGAVAQFRSGNWVVFEAEDAVPKVMNDREYARYRQTAPDLVQVEPTGHGTGVTRFTLGRLDSGRSGEPAIATYDRTMRRTTEAWFLEGRPATRESVEAAHAALDPFPGSLRA
jgi:hypothetical protein